MLLLFISFESKATSVDACGTIDAISLENTGLQDILNLVKEEHPDIQLCWFRQACNMYTSSQPKEVPADSKCKKSYKYGQGDETFSCGLSYIEKTALGDYSDSYYLCMNAYLRQKDVKSPALDAYIKLVNDALDRLPNYEGVVVRGSDLPPKIAELHKKGNTVIYDGFTSTSTESGFGGKDRFVIISKTGKPIMGLSYHEGENEVLFKSGTKFEVLDTYKEGGVNYYVMKEVVGEPSSEEEKKADLALVEKIKNNKDSGADTWYCPTLGDEVPKSVQQKYAPSIKISNSYINEQPWLEKQNGIWMKCESTESEDKCSEIDMKKGPEPAHMKVWEYYDEEKDEELYCTWDKGEINCKTEEEYYESSAYEYKSINNGIISSCKYTASGSVNCKEIDQKKAPGENELKEFMAYDPSGATYQKCAWTGEAYKCEKMENAYSSTYNMYQNQEYKMIVDGKLQHCKQTPEGMKCADVDLKKAPAENEPKEFFAYDSKKGMYEKCAWTGETYKCEKMEGGYAGGMTGGGYVTGSGSGASPPSYEWKQIINGKHYKCKGGSMSNECEVYNPEKEMNGETPESFYDVDTKKWKVCTYKDGKMECKELNAGMYYSSGQSKQP